MLKTNRSEQIITNTINDGERRHHNVRASRSSDGVVRFSCHHQDCSAAAVYNPDAAGSPYSPPGNPWHQECPAWTALIRAMQSKFDLDRDRLHR